MNGQRIVRELGAIQVRQRKMNSAGLIATLKPLGKLLEAARVLPLTQHGITAQVALTIEATRRRIAVLQVHERQAFHKRQLRQLTTPKKRGWFS